MCNTEFKNGDRVQLAQMSENKAFIPGRFQLGMQGSVIRHYITTSEGAYTLVKWDNGIETTSNNKNIKKV